MLINSHILHNLHPNLSDFLNHMILTDVDQIRNAILNRCYDIMKRINGTRQTPYKEKNSYSTPYLNRQKPPRQDFRKNNYRDRYNDYRPRQYSPPRYRNNDYYRHESQKRKLQF